MYEVRYDKKLGLYYIYNIITNKSMYFKSSEKEANDKLDELLNRKYGDDWKLKQRKY